MQKKDLVCVRRVSFELSGQTCIRYAVLYDGLFITSFEEGDLSRALHVACNVWFAVCREIKNPEDIVSYE